MASSKGIKQLNLSVLEIEAGKEGVNAAQGIEYLNCLCDLFVKDPANVINVINSHGLKRAKQGKSRL